MIAHTPTELSLMKQIIEEHLQLKAEVPLESLLEAAELIHIAPKILRRCIFLKPRNNVTYTPPELVAMHNIVKHYKAKNNKEAMFRDLLLGKLNYKLINLNLNLMYSTESRVLPSKINHLISC